jgi:hypothetical protein
MIDTNQAREIMSRVVTLEPPILSLYLAVAPDPAAQRALALRAAAAIDELGIDSELGRQVLAAVTSERRKGTLAAFASDATLDLFELDARLPIGSAATGRVEAHWGEPYVAPLVLALDQRRRCATICLDRRRVRVFEVFLGEIELLIERSRVRPPDVDDSLEPAKQVHPAYVPSRDSASKDRADRHLDEWRAGLYRQTAAEVRALLRVWEIDSVILMGNEKHVSAFIDACPAEIRERIVARLPACGRTDASRGEVLAHVREAIDEADARRDEALLRHIEESGLVGLEDTLRALQLGQLSTVAAAWDLQDLLRADADTAQIVPGGDQLPAGRLDDRSARLLLPRLAAQQGTELVFLPGAAGDRLLRDAGGIGGVRRWR